MSEQLERALRAFDAQAFAERHGGYKESTSPRSHEYLLPCPFPDCGSDRLRWRHEPGHKLAWICWGCRRTGDTLELIQYLERTDLDGALNYLYDGYTGGDSPTELREVARIAQPARVTLERMPVINPPRGFELLDFTSPAHADAARYLIAERGLRPGDEREFRLGYARAGWLAGYVIFPVYMDGGLVYWQGRACWDPPPGLAGDHRKAWVKATSYRKTLNPTNRPGAATAEEVLFNYDRARAETHVVVVEGPIDAVKVGPHAVALLGKVASETKVERLLRMSAHRYTVYLDPGEEEAAKAAALAAQLNEWVPTFIATPPPGADPGALSREQNATIIEQATPFRASGLTSELRVR